MIFAQIVKFIHLLSLTFWLGSVYFFSLIAAPLIFKGLDREKAGEVIGLIFPKYWLLGYIGSSLSVVTLVILTYGSANLPVARLVVLTAMTVTTFYSGMVVGTDAREIKAKIKKAGSDEEKQALRQAFKKTHAKSAILNLIVMILGLVLIFLTARELNFN